MQNYCKTIGALAAASALVAGNALAGTAPVAPSSAPESGIQYELHTGYTSEYLFRGTNLGQDLVEVGADVAGELYGFGLSGGAWYGSVHNAPGFPGFTQESYDEIDVYVEASRDLGFATAAIGYIYYHFPKSFAGSFIQDAQEVYFSVSRDFGFVNSSLTYFWDVETDNEGYTELALDRSFELTSCLDLSVASSLGVLTEGVELAHWTTKVAVDWSFAESATLSPFVALSIALGDDAGTPWGVTDNELVAGSMLSVSF